VHAKSQAKKLADRHAALKLVNSQVSLQHNLGKGKMLSETKTNGKNTSVCSSIELRNKLRLLISPM
jgi:hypothetical protein